jgi:phosphoglycerate dehydrogenase-like enzyme
LNAKTRALERCSTLSFRAAFSARFRNSSPPRHTYGGTIVAQAEIGLIGLGVMGSNLALNIAEKGNKIAVFNRTVARTRRSTSRWICCVPISKRTTS